MNNKLIDYNYILEKNGFIQCGWTNVIQYWSKQLSVQINIYDKKEFDCYHYINDGFEKIFNTQCISELENSIISIKRKIKIKNIIE